MLDYGDAHRGRKGISRPLHYRKVDEIPFDFVRWRLSVVVAGDRDEHLLVCKGAVEEMLAISAFTVGPDGPRSLDAEQRSKLAAHAEALNEDGLRVILVASREFPEGARGPDHLGELRIPNAGKRYIHAIRRL